MSTKRSKDFHKNASLDNFTKGASQQSSGVVDLVTSVFTAVFDQWKQLVMFLSPYVETVRSFPKKVYSDVLLPHAQCAYNGLCDKFTDYNFSKFVSDVLNITLAIVLFPFIMAVAILGIVRDKCSNLCGTCCDVENGDCTWIRNFQNLLHERCGWLISTCKRMKKWLTTTWEELRSGDITWKDLWNDMLDCIDAQLQRVVVFFGETSMFTWMIKVSRIRKILEMLHLDVHNLKKE